MCVSVYVTSGDLTVKLSMSILLRYARRVGFLPAAWRRRPRRRRKGRKIPSYIWHHIHNRVPYVVDSFYIADYVDCTSKHYFIYYHVYYCTPLITVRNSLYGYIIIRLLWLIFIAVFWWPKTTILVELPIVVVGRERKLAYFMCMEMLFICFKIWNIYYLASCLRRYLRTVVPSKDIWIPS